MSMTPEKTVYLCPACSKRTFVVHCDNRSCTWMKCRDDKACDLQLDMRKHAGHRLAPRLSPNDPIRRERWAS